MLTQAQRHSIYRSIASTYHLSLLPAVAVDNDAMPGLTACLIMKIISSDTGNSIYATVVGPDVDAMLDYSLLPVPMQKSRRVACSLLQAKAVSAKAVQTPPNQSA